MVGMKTALASQPIQLAESSLKVYFNYALTGVGLILLLVLGVQAVTHLTDPAYVKGKPKTQQSPTASSVHSALSNLGAQNQSFAPVLVPVTESNKTTEGQSGGKSQDNKQTGKSLRSEVPVNVPQNIEEAVERMPSQHAKANR